MDVRLIQSKNLLFCFAWFDCYTERLGRNSGLQEQGSHFKYASLLGNCRQDSSHHRDFKYSDFYVGVSLLKRGQKRDSKRIYAETLEIWRCPIINQSSCFDDNENVLRFSNVRNNNPTSKRHHLLWDLCVLVPSALFKSLKN